jgi:hypothetical protein
VSFELTCDPTVIIVYRQPHFLIYYSIPSDEQWIIYGDCTHNGSCIDGAINPDTRPYSERLDVPVRPELKCKGCDLRGLYL